MSWAFCDNTPLLITIGGTRIPTQKVEIYINKKGNADINRYAKVYFPAEWEGKSVINEIDSFSPNDQSSYDMASLFMRDQVSGQLIPTMRGYVAGPGAATSTNGLMMMWIADVSKFMSAIEFSASYTNATTAEVMSDVQESIQQNTIFSDVKISTTDPQKQVTEGTPPKANVGGSNVSPVGDYTGLLSGIADSLTENQPFINQDATRKFQKNRATLKDAMDWITSTLGGAWYFSFDGSNLVLVYSDSIQQNTFTEDSTNIIDNDAFQEILPYNSIQANGSTGVSIAGHDLAFFPGKKYPTATAVYPPLVERTGGLTQPKVVEAKATTVKSAENVAKTELRKSLETLGEGDILMHGCPAVSLYDKLTARPICSEQLTNSSATPLDYEIQGVTHTCEEGVFKTRVNVSMHIDYNQIQIEESKMEEI